MRGWTQSAIDAANDGYEQPFDSDEDFGMGYKFKRRI